MGFDPCGQVMDFIRAAYSTQCVFDRAGEVTATITWYEAAPGAAMFPGRHHFGSLNWSLGRTFSTEGPGEVQGASRPFRSGVIPGRPSGVHHDGPDWYFVEGQPVDAAPLARSDSGIPLDCASLPQLTPCSQAPIGGKWTMVGPGTPYDGQDLAYFGSGLWGFTDPGQWSIALRCVDPDDDIAEFDVIKLPVGPVSHFNVHPDPPPANRVQAHSPDHPFAEWPDLIEFEWHA